MCYLSSNGNNHYGPKKKNHKTIRKAAIKRAKLIVCVGGINLLKGIKNVVNNNIYVVLRDNKSIVIEVNISR